METEALTLAKQQLKWTKILTAAVLLLLCLGLLIAFFLIKTAQTAQALGAELRVVTARVEEVTRDLNAAELQESIDSLQSTAGKLAAIDWEALSVNANATLEQAQQSLQAVAEAMDKMDFDALNQAVSNLQTVIEPLARFTARFS